MCKANTYPLSRVGVGIILLPFSVGVATCAQTGSERADPKVDDVIAVFRQRERDYQWAKLECRHTFTLLKGTALGKSKGDKPLALPKDDIIFEGKTQLLLGPTEFRVESDDCSFEMSKQQLVRQRQIGVYKNGESRTYIPKGLIDIPIGNIDDASFSNIPQYHHTKAMFLLLRPLQTGLVAPAKVKLISATLQGQKCAIIEDPTERHKWSIWVGTNHPHPILRYSLSSNGRIMVNCDFQYGRSDTFPQKWECSSYTALGKLSEHTITEVSALESGKPLPASEFDLQFPPGTVIQDSRKAKGPATVRSIVLENGDTREIKGDSRLAYQELFESQSISMSKAILAGGFLMFVGGAVCAYWKRRKGKSS